MSWPRNRSIVDILPGHKYGRLTVIQFDHYDRNWRKHYLCKCACGKEKIVQGSLLISGNTRSCGCLSSDTRLNRMPNQHGAVTQIILGYKRHAKDRGINFLLSRDEVDLIIRQSCIYCGDPHGNTLRGKNIKEGFSYNGIDRVDSSCPYVGGNVVPCCGRCNKAKGSYSAQDFISWAIKIARLHTSELYDGRAVGTNT